MVGDSSEGWISRRLSLGERHLRAHAFQLLYAFSAAAVVWFAPPLCFPPVFFYELRQFSLSDPAMPSTFLWLSVVRDHAHRDLLRHSL